MENISTFMGVESRPLDNLRLSIWSVQLVLVSIVLLIALSVYLLDTTDIPFIRNLPSAPGLPILGNLVELGAEQPRRLAELAKVHGPVYQIRLGNKVDA